MAAMREVGERTMVPNAASCIESGMPEEAIAMGAAVKRCRFTKLRRRPSASPPRSACEFDCGGAPLASWLPWALLPIRISPWSRCGFRRSLRLRSGRFCASSAIAKGPCASKRRCAAFSTTHARAPCRCSAGPLTWRFVPTQPRSARANCLRGRRSCSWELPRSGRPSRRRPSVSSRMEPGPSGSCSTLTDPQPRSDSSSR
ncbi:MAG: hypothetical protein JNJ88_05485 [Planctomycetes bacterium]|nr:hypothetical protein [Planctomycetota bacterium]